VTVYDEEHSETEDRWMTMGLSAGGGLLVVSHTFEELGEQMVRVRIISSRRANREEEAEYGS
jgi:hypothetical protein